MAQFSTEKETNQIGTTAIMKKTLDPTNYKHVSTDPWRWRAASGPDVPAIVQLVIDNYTTDVETFLPIHAVELSRNVMFAIVNQMYNPKKELISVAVHEASEQIVAFTWAQRDIRNPWSVEEMIAPKMLSIDLRLNTHVRVALCIQAIIMWERWAQVCEIPVINSNTLRKEWTALMRLHTLMGYQVRGSIAFKRLNTINIEQETGRIILP